MRLAQMDPNALGRLTHHLHGRSWMGARWHGAPRDFALAWTDTLAAAVATGATDNAVTAAFASAVVRTPVAYPVVHETWGRAVHLSLACALYAESDAELPPAPADGLCALASELVSAADGLTPRQVRHTRLNSLERVTRDARKALQAARGAVGIDPAGAAFGVAFLDQVGHQLPFLTPRTGKTEAVVIEAFKRADAEARKGGSSPWAFCTPVQRQKVARQSLVIAIEALLAGVVNAGGATPGDRDAELWLARSATEMLMCAPLVRAWFSEGPMRPAATVATVPEGKTTAAVPRGNGAEAAMTETTHPMLKTLQTDATDAAWRTAGSQFVKLAREPLVALLSRHLGPDDESLRARIATFMETEIGTAMLTALLSVGLSSLPATGSPVPEKLARELRIRAMADTADVVADVLVGPLRQVVSLYLKDVTPTLQPTMPGSLPEPLGASLPTTVHSAVDEPSRR